MFVILQPKTEKTQTPMEQHTHHSHNDNHEHHHHHHHHIEAANGEKIRGILIISILLNLLFVAVEAIVGLTQNSL